MANVRDIEDVAESQLCCGCGARAHISPDEIRIHLAEVDGGSLVRRPASSPANATAERR